MTATETGQPSAAQRAWADAENQRRADEYARADDEWSATEQALARLIEVARTGSNATPQVATSVSLKRGEVVHATVNDCSLLEVQRAPGHYAGGYSGFSVRLSNRIRYNVGGSRGSYVQGNESLKVTDAGSATVTNKRVVFQGALRGREWAYSKLIGIEHDPERPLTLIHVSSRQKVSGLAYPADTTTDFRFALEFGTAEAADRTSQVIAELESEHAAHQQARPRPPVWATPADAPPLRSFGTTLGATLTGRKGQPAFRRIVHTATTGAVTLLLVGGVAIAARPHDTGATSHALVSTPESSTVPVKPMPSTTLASPPSKPVLVQIVVPKLVGIKAAKAQRSAQKRGLTISLVTKPSSARSGIVLTQSTPAGHKVDRGTPVTLVVASPLPRVVSVIGRDWFAARRTLASAGFKVQRTYQTTTSGTDGTVLSQSPSAGTAVRPGATVRVVVARNNCTPGYSPCLPFASDYDCAGGSGNGPKYVYGTVRVTGDDPYGLDADGDGYGCD